MSVATKLKNYRVRWFTDNQNVARILLVGSKKPQLHAEAIKVLSLSVHYQIRLEPEWIPRHLNERADERADYLSRIVDHDDWQLNPVVFADLDVAWGPIQLTVLRVFTIARYRGLIVGVGILGLKHSQ